MSINWYNLYKQANRREDAWLTGPLKQTDDGFVYVDVPNDIINGFYYALQHETAVQPPYREPKYNSIGAHISVMDPEEIEEHVLIERGRKIRYQVKGVFRVEPGRGKAKALWAVGVHSPDLEEIRKRYGLGPLLRGHDFHITFAQEYFES